MLAAVAARTVVAPGADPVEIAHRVDARWRPSRPRCVTTSAAAAAVRERASPASCSTGAAAAVHAPVARGAGRRARRAGVTRGWRCAAPATPPAQAHASRALRGARGVARHRLSGTAAARDPDIARCLPLHADGKSRRLRRRRHARRRRDAQGRRLHHRLRRRRRGHRGAARAGGQRGAGRSRRAATTRAPTSRCARTSPTRCSIRRRARARPRTSGITILQGRAVGGTHGRQLDHLSFRTPDARARSLAEGARRQRLHHSRSSTPHWDAVEERLNIEQIPLEETNRNNRTLYDGCKALGLQVDTTERNVKRCMQDAATAAWAAPSTPSSRCWSPTCPTPSPHGARVLSRCRVDKLVVEAGSVTRAECTRHRRRRLHADRARQLTVAARPLRARRRAPSARRRC